MAHNRQQIIASAPTRFSSRWMKRNGGGFTNNFRTRNDLPEPFGPLYAEAGRYEDMAGEVDDRIVATKPVTLDGAIALPEFASEAPEAVATVIEGLRAIVEREARP
jgi:hypothetical protein